MTLNVPQFDTNTFAIGFEELFRRLDTTRSQQLSYPPYNIRRTTDTEYVIEIAVAGFGTSDVDVELTDNVLKISGEIKQGDKEEYIHKGIASRAFHRTFTLAEHIEVKSTDLINGLLIIWLERVVPEEKRPKKIAIGSAPDKKLLVESKKK